MKIKYRNKSGQILTEVMVALSVLVVGFLGMFQLLSQSFKLSRQATDSYVATYLAGEGIELVKNQIDHNFILRDTNPLIPWNQGFVNGDFEAEFIPALPALPVAFPVNMNRFLLYDVAGKYYSYSSGTPTPFRRLIRILQSDLDGDGVYDKMKVNSIVSWTVSGQSNQIDVEDHFYNWRIVNPP